MSREDLIKLRNWINDKESKEYLDFFIKNTFKKSVSQTLLEKV
jgi:hypothetical protein